LDSEVFGRGPLLRLFLFDETEQSSMVEMRNDLSYVMAILGLCQLADQQTTKSAN